MLRRLTHAQGRQDMAARPLVLAARRLVLRKAGVAQGEEDRRNRRNKQNPGAHPVPPNPVSFPVRPFYVHRQTASDISEQQDARHL